MNVITVVIEAISITTIMAIHHMTVMSKQFVMQIVLDLPDETIFDKIKNLIDPFIESLENEGIGISQFIVNPIDI